MAIDMRRFLARFVEEARDLLSQLQGRLDYLRGPNLDPEVLNATFRLAHTLKGSSRMLKLTAIADTAHAIEEVLEALRSGKITVTPELDQLLRRGVDTVADLVEVVAGNGVLPAADAPLCTALIQASQNAASPPPEAGSAPSPSPPKAGSALSPSPPEAGSAPSPSPPKAGSVPSPPPPEAGSVLSPPPPEAGSAPSPPPPEAGRRLPPPPDTIRVNLRKLDDLIALMSGVVASHKRLRHRFAEIRQLSRQSREMPDASGVWQGHVDRLQQFSSQLRDNILDLDQQIAQLGERTLSMRMLPLSTLFESSAWLVRDTARALGKEVICQVQGAEIELDRRVIDLLSDPLLHLLRNAVDHGLEAKEERIANGKSPQGTVRLAARQDGNGVVIEVEDDGRGLDLERIKAKAVQKGVLDRLQSEALTPEQAAELIFLPGLSTSSLITDLSGRGVGMDVVKRKVEDDLRGDIQIRHRPGQGIRFQLRFPLSLAMMRVLLCRVGGYQVGIAAQYIRELLRVPVCQVVSVAGQPVVKVDNEFIPLARLSTLLGFSQEGLDLSGHSALLLVLVRSEQHQLALVVDGLQDEQDMVIKPVPEHLRPLALVNGLVVTGADELVPVLQVPGLVERARARRGEQVARLGAVGSTAGFHILVVDDSLNTREIEREVLQSHGYQVTLAEDGLDGWQKAVAGRFDAVITDVEMPGLDGFSLTERLRQEERYRHTPIVMLTSRAREEDQRRGAQVGASAYIVKGDFDQGNLIDTLRNLLA